MYLKELRIGSKTSGSTIRTVKFTHGANFIVDNSESEDHNKVGKTTFLTLIDILMGASKRSKIYDNQQENVKNEALEKRINEEKIFVELDLSTARNWNSTENFEIKTLSVDLFTGGKRRINGKNFAERRYQAELNKIIFNNALNVPTFRQLIGAFVRVDEMKDDVSILRFSSSYTKDKEYRSIYDYLFHLADPQKSKLMAELLKEQGTLENFIKRYKKLQNVKDSNQIKTEIIALREKRTLLRNQMSDILSPREFENNRSTIFSLRTAYEQISLDVSELEFAKERLEASINEASEELESEINLELAKRFFDEVKDLVPQIQREFGEMVNFNRQLARNKITFLADSLHQVDEDLQQKLVELNSLKNENEKFLAFLQNSEEFDRYSEFLSKLNEIEVQLGKLNEFLINLENLTDEERSIADQVGSLKQELESTSSLDPNSPLGQFNSTFASLTKRINGETPVLNYSEDVSDFPMSFSNLEGVSSGTRKSLAAAYDFSYQTLARARGYSVPNFVVHDLVENIDGKDFKQIVNLAIELDIQFIVAVLQEKLDSSEIESDLQREHTILTLSTGDRTFRD